MRPPTTVDLEQGPFRTNVVRPQEPLTVICGDFRRDAQKAIRWRLALTQQNRSKLDTHRPDSDDDSGLDEDTDVVGVGLRAKSRLDARDDKDAKMRKTLHPLALKVAGASEALGTWFGVHVLSEYSTKTEGAHRVYLELLEQVGRSYIHKTCMTDCYP